MASDRQVGTWTRPYRSRVRHLVRAAGADWWTSTCGRRFGFLTSTEGFPPASDYYPKCRHCEAEAVPPADRPAT